MQTGVKVVAPELAMSMWAGDNPLTEREREILQLIAAGKTSQEVSDELYLSHGTVRNYISEMLQKLNAKNRIEAIAIAESKGWLK
jgi:two-component system response regulator DesR